MWIAEPATALTDYLLTVECFFFSLRLRGLSEVRGRRLWMFAFLALGVGALAGGSFHGFRPVLSGKLSAGLWNTSMILIGTAAGFMMSGVIVSRAARARRWLLVGLGVSIAAGVLLALKIGLHESFNHNDLFHCIMLFSLYAYYRGARLLGDAV